MWLRHLKLFVERVETYPEIFVEFSQDRHEMYFGPSFLVRYLSFREENFNSNLYPY